MRSILSMKRNFAVISIVIFIFNLCYSMLIPVLPIYFGEKGLSLFVVGSLFSIYAISRAIVQIPIGLIIDNIEKSKFIKYLFLCLTIIFLLYITIKGTVSLYLLRVFEGILAGFTSPLIYSMLSFNILDEDNGINIGYFTTISSLGLAIGPFFTGILQNNMCKNEVFFIIAAVGSLLATLIIQFHYRKQEELYENINNKNVNTKLKDNIKPLTKEIVSIITIALIAFLGDFIFGIIALVLPLYFADNYSHLLGYAAYLLSINFFIFALLSPINGKLVDKFGFMKIIKISLAMISCSFILIFLSDDIKVIFIAMICEAVFGSMLFCANQVYAMKLGRRINSTGKVFGVVGTFQSIGTAVGPLLAGYVYTISSKCVFLMLGLVGIILFFIINIIFIKKKDRAKVMEI